MCGIHARFKVSALQVPLDCGGEVRGGGKDLQLTGRSVLHECKFILLSFASLVLHLLDAVFDAVVVIGMGL